MSQSIQHGVYGGWWGAGIAGLGDSGETDVEGSGLPTGGSVDWSSGEVDPSTYYQAPGYDLTTVPGVELSPVELAAEQTRAYAWLQALPNVVNVAGKVALSASQIAQGIQQGVVKASSTCQSGYMVPGGQCVQAQGSQLSLSGQLIPGVPNKTLLIVGAGVLMLMILSQSGGRRR